MLINLHRLNTSNVGDLACAPALYFEELSSCQRMEILGWKASETPDNQARKEWKERFSEAHGFIVGGGGLLECDFFDSGFEHLLKNRRPDQKVVIWGAGHNNWKIGDWRVLKQNISLDKYAVDLIGVRDYNHPVEWVPCVSCMSPLFDKNYEVSHEVGLYVHDATLKNESFAKSLPVGFRTLSNSANFEDAVEFLGASELVLTDSYHGMYWATLLGRRVIAFPTSSKFYDTKHPVPLCAPQDWERFRKLTTIYSTALFECRTANRRFSEIVFKLFQDGSRGF